MSFKEPSPTESIIYHAHIAANIRRYKGKLFLGLSKTTFKVRYGNHKKSFEIIEEMLRLQPKKKRMCLMPKEKVQNS